MLLKALLKVAAESIGMSAEQLVSAGRRTKFVRVRRAFSIVARERGYSLLQIGRFLGNDHSTVHWHLVAGHQLMQTDAAFVSLVEKLRAFASAEQAERMRILAEASAAARERQHEAEAEERASAEAAEEERAVAHLRGVPRMMRGADCYETSGMPRSWWVANNERFAKVMEREHPGERYPHIAMRRIPGTVEEAAA